MSEWPIADLFPLVGAGERVVGRLLAPGGIDIAGISIPAEDEMVWRCGCGFEGETFGAVLDHAEAEHGLVFA